MPAGLAAAISTPASRNSESDMGNPSERWDGPIACSQLAHLLYDEREICRLGCLSKPVCAQASWVMLRLSFVDFDCRPGSGFLCSGIRPPPLFEVGQHRGKIRHIDIASANVAQVIAMRLFLDVPDAVFGN